MPTLEDAPLETKARVVATKDLPGVPEGTRGTVRGSVGFALTRYRVDFDNGAQRLSVLARDLVPVSQWRQFRIDRKRAREAAEAAGETEATADAGESGSAAGGSGDGGGAPADDRLAALLAKSKAARAAKDG